MCISRSFSAQLIAFLLVGASALAEGAPVTCTYETYRWNIRLRQAVDFRLVRKDYSAVTAAEVDADTGCTVCEEDQVVIELDGVAPFRICRAIAPQVTAVLQHLSEREFPLFKIEGYRVGRTRGDADENGYRTRFSNHSFGIALDINPGQNGLYDGCPVFGPECRLIRGGDWNPGTIEGSILSDGDVVRLFKEAGFRWGGEIEGQQKDFMHFSPSGY